MPSRSSSSHPESSHPYRDTRSQSTTSLQTTASTKKKSWMSHLIPKTRREGLLPLPEGARLSSPSPPPKLPNILHTSLELPHPARTPDLPPVSGDSKWAETFDPSPLPPITILGQTGTPLHHPQPVLPLQSSGIMSTSPTALTSPLPEQTLPTIARHPQEAMPMHGISPRPGNSRHSSLYESRHPSPVPPPTFTPHREAVGETSGHPSGPRTVLLEPLAGSSLRTGSSLSSSMRSQSQQETQREIGQQSRPATPARPLTHHDPLPPFRPVPDHIPDSTPESSQ